MTSPGDNRHFRLKKIPRGVGVQKERATKGCKLAHFLPMLF